jgi:hypothetical protein
MNVRGVVAIVSLSLCVAVAHAQTAYDTLVKQGNAQLQAGNATSALASGQKAIAADPARWEAYTVTGGALMNLKRYDEALGQLSNALSRAPATKQAALQALIKKCALATAQTPASGLPTTTAPPPPSTSVTQAEIVLWETIKNSTNPDDYKIYLKQYPQGAYVALANAKLEQMAWSAIQNSSNAGDFTDFIRLYPNSAYAEQAQQRVDQIHAQVIQQAKQAEAQAAENQAMFAQLQQKRAAQAAIEMKTGVWMDPATGLMWQKFSPPLSGTSMDTPYDGDYDGATRWCQAVVQWAGFKDWRLPTIDELKAVYDPLAKSHTKGDLLDLLGEDAYRHTNVNILNAFWSSTSSSKSQKVFYFDFTKGKQGEMDMGHLYTEKESAKHHGIYSSDLAVLCVRSAAK